jgi:hypothetical protein
LASWQLPGAYFSVVLCELDKGFKGLWIPNQHRSICQAVGPARGHEGVVKLLLNKSADVNAQGGYYGNALQAASAKGHEAVVKMLVSRGAKPL